ncbi:MAG: YncE family protein, partial [Candidatus Eremiobacteraeota bacterium]|nr:YncE family protein [Candidatus Eremiobacteraeota bacterium]
MKRHTVAASLAVAAFATGAYASEPAYHVAETVKLGGSVRWDYLTYETGRNRLFITRADRVDVFDAASKTINGSIPGTRGVHGVALAPELDLGFASDGADNNVTVFTLSSLKTTATVAAGGNPDAIVYDPATKRVFTGNGKSADLTAIDAAAGKTLTNIPVGGKPEFIAVDGKGRLYVNIESTNQLLVVD